MSADSFAKVMWAAEERHTSPTYGWDNSRRNGDNHLVVQYTLEGAAFFRDAGGERLVPAGSAMLFTLKEPSSYGYPPGAAEPYRHRFVAFSPAASVWPIFQQLRTDFDSIVAMPLKSRPELLFRELFTRFAERTFDDRLHEAELAYRFLTALYREQVQDTHATDPIEYGYHYLRNHFRSPVNLKIIADKCGVTREHFSRRFVERYRETPGTMLRRLRLEHASAMLSATALSVEEVALASGFTSPTSMSRAFRLKYGRSPRGREQPRIFRP
jgi:AraC-like DNA-binding protein